MPSQCLAAGTSEHLICFPSTATSITKLVRAIQIHNTAGKSASGQNAAFFLDMYMCAAASVCDALSALRRYRVRQPTLWSWRLCAGRTVS